MTRRHVALVWLLLTGVVLAGCGAVSSAATSGPAMMGGSTGVTSASGRPGMMADCPAYSYSRLSCSPPSSLPGQRVTVTLADMGMTQMMGGIAPLGFQMMLRAAPGSVAAGQITLVAINVGWRTHELVILPLAAGGRIPASDGKVSETGSLGEASGSCAGGAGQGISAGKVGWVKLTLHPGRYELACNLPNHYADGMHQEFTVR